MAHEYTDEERRSWLEGLPAIPAGAVMLMEDKEEKLLVVKAHYRHYWTPPGGVIDLGESPSQAAIRETREEVGLLVEPDEVRFVSVSYRRSAAFRDTYQFIFKIPFKEEWRQLISLRAKEIEKYDFVTKNQVRADETLYSSAAIHWANESLPWYDEQESR